MIAIVIAIILVGAPTAIWYMSPYEREFRRMRRQRDDLRKLRSEGWEGVSVDNRKYTFISGPSGNIRIHRYGQSWIQEVDGTNALHAMMAELDAARVVLEAARSIPLLDCTQGDIIAFFDRMRTALDRHDRLVDDRQSPSDWTK